MKKVLFGIMALSMTAFTATNPGDKTNGASVPVRVIAEVVKPADSLVITDEAGTILDELLLDHKIVAGTSNSSDSVVTKNFKVKVTNADGAVDINNKGNVTIALDQTTTTLTKVGSAAIPANQITSNLRLVNGTGGDTNAPNIGVDSYKYEALLSGGEHLGTITSTIAARSVPTTAGSGAYDNKVTGTMPTLTVTYTATPPQP